MPHACLVRRIATGFLALMATLVLVSTGDARAADAKPVKKDSRVATRPKEATFTTSVSPSRARPGDTVTFSVTARLADGWHIYAYNKTQPDDGPRVTQFDFFDPAGLTPHGAWSPDKPASRKKEEAFPALPFVEYHQGEVTWSLPLVVPSDASPGKKSLRVQAGYQICSDATCSFPGQWTLPAAELTVVAGAGGQVGISNPFPALISIGLLQADAKPAETGKKPATKDSSARLKPKGVVLTASIDPAEAKVGQVVTYKVTAKTVGKNHIYKYSKQEADVGPKLTTFDFFDPAGLTPRGDWTASKEPTKKHEDAFKEIPFLEFYEDEVTWSLELVVPPGTEPGKKTLRCQAGYMVCDDKNCSIPGQWTLPDVELTIVPGVVATAAAAPKPTETPAAPKGEVKAVEDGPKSEVEKQAALGLLPFLLTCAGGGLIALAMPCVWPMIPITVNFFVKQGQKGKSTTGLAIVYCLSIIGVFTGVGILFSIFFGAASLSALANNPWVNFFVAGLFLAFGLSLLGLFEIRLPNFLLNASAQGEGKGGLVGVMFMALTLTITSFTCTFPVVGGLLVMAAGGSYFYPVIGLATFAGVIALPFLLLALSPGLLSKVPKSGDWMNAVKVVGGLIEIGAAFKFINTAETAFVVAKEAWFNAYAVLAIWVVLALVCGIYLLGLFRTDHDHEAVTVGPGRMVLGCLFLFMALFLAPALFGRPPQSKLWYMVVGLLPADAADLKAPVGVGPAHGGEETHATSNDPALAERQEKTFHGVTWGMSYEAALEESKATGKPILIDFTGVNCANCRLMEQEVLPRPEVVAELKKFIPVQLYTDQAQIGSITAAERERLGRKNLDLALKLASEVTNPLYVIVGPDESPLGAKGGKMSPDEFVKHLNVGLARLKKTDKVAQAAGGK
jgi:thiol:disulfide interchange protein